MTRMDLSNQTLQVGQQQVRSHTCAEQTWMPADISCNAAELAASDAAAGFSPLLLAATHAGRILLARALRTATLDSADD